MIGYAINAALNAGVFDEVIVSTEDKEIKDVAISLGAIVDDRPQYMAGDKVTNVQVVKEYLERNINLQDEDTITTLLPTCPFRTSDHLKEAYQLFTKYKSELPFLIGVTDYEFPIQLALSRTESSFVEMTFEDGYNTTRSQNIEKRYHPNGAMYMATVKAFMKNGTFFNQKMNTYKMSAVHSYDIDYPYQFEIAEILIKKIENNEL